MKTASKPNTTANPIITSVLARIEKRPLFAACEFFSRLLRMIFGVTRIELVKAAAVLRLCSTLDKTLLFTDRPPNIAQLN